MMMNNDNWKEQKILKMVVTHYQFNEDQTRRFIELVNEVKKEVKQ